MVTLMGSTVTTGTRSYGVNPNVTLPAPNTSGSYGLKGWNGSDGKYAGNGLLKENPWTMNNLTKTWKAGPYGCVIPGENQCGITAQWSNNDLNRLNGNLISKLNGHQLQLGVALGEGRQTYRMIIDNVTAIGGALRDARKGDLRSAKRLLAIAQPQRKDVTAWAAVKGSTRFKSKTLANRWLELQYGWKPLLSDVHEGMKAWAVLADPPRIWVVKASYKPPVERMSCSSSLNTINGYRAETKAQVSGRIKYVLTETLSTPRSLGLLNPEAVAWEIMPWSFVIDWFIPIGTYLTNMNTVPKLTGQTVVTTFKRYKCVARGQTTLPGGYYKSVGVTEKIDLIRTVNAGLKSKMPQFVGLDRALSPARLWNALALATQRATRK